MVVKFAMVQPPLGGVRVIVEVLAPVAMLVLVLVMAKEGKTPQMVREPSVPAEAHVTVRSTWVMVALALR
jgi:hypothetical protein